MAHHLAKIHGTEEDKVNCPFYYKIGACRHGDRCSRIHHKPAFSPTLLIKHLYVNPKQPNNSGSGNDIPNPDQALEDYLCFYEDLFLEFSKVGPVLEMHVVDNLSDHMIGNVYVKMRDEELAADALSVMNGRYYDGRIIQLEYSPVTDFREARCRAHEEGECDRGSVSCNFLHIKPIPELLVRSLEDEAEYERRKELDKDRRDRDRHHRDRDGGGDSRHHKKEKKRKREHRHSRSSSRERDRDRDRDRGSSSKRGRSSSSRRDRRSRDRDGSRSGDDRSTDGSSSRSRSN